MALGARRCSKDYLRKAATKDGYISYGFLIDEVTELEEESVPGRERSSASGDTSKAAVAAFVLVFLRPGKPHINIGFIRLNYNRYRGILTNRNWNCDIAGAGDLNLDTFIDYHFLSPPYGDSVEVCKENLSKTRALISKVGYVLSTSKKVYGYLLKECTKGSEECALEQRD